MRQRTTVTAAALAALFAVCCLPAAPASAATGTFAYTFRAPRGVLTSVLTDPPSGICLPLPEVLGPHALGPAYAPHNDTGAPARVFTGPDCTGGYATLRPHGRRAPVQVLLRSVLFTPRAGRRTAPCRG
ncbi:hypothetical protein [Actinacidiphila alni]|nr:hypothetical protein [Actinacidiphila alni]